MNAPRVGLIGARRARQGLGPFVARFLAQAGAEVVALAGTSEESATRAREELSRVAGLAPRPYADGRRMLADERLDALAVLCPAEHHRAWLEHALSAGVAVLCEKPFVWNGAGDADDAARLVQAFAERGLLLRENCQWPFTLPAYHALHPEAAGRRPQRFAMRLSPSVTGVEMIGDSLPHPLSLLQCLCPGDDGRVEDVRFSSHAPSAAALEVAFRWVAGGHRTDVLVELVQERTQPRQAGYALDGRWAFRLVRKADYALFLASGAEVVDVPDPLQQLVRRFVDELSARRAGRPGRGSAGRERQDGDAVPGADPLGGGARIAARAAALAALRRAFERGAG